jgi:Fic family protein
MWALPLEASKWEYRVGWSHFGEVIATPAKSSAERWQAAHRESRPWRQTVRAGTRADRMFSEVLVTLPPLIAGRPIPLTASQAGEVEEATREVMALDTSSGETLQALGVLLLRTESVASSKIERVEASLDDFARALHGVRTNSSAMSMVAATRALSVMIDRVSSSSRLDLADITAAHAALMVDDPDERAYAGRLRDMQNWVGGSNYSPRNALFVPPPPETVRGYVDDLVDFANREDMPALVQAAIAHAQFETIHPFTDGNGRIGRALINSILRRRGITTHVVVPLATALVAHRDRYFDLLTDYREGRLDSLLSSFAESTRIAAAESRVTARRLEMIPAEWASQTGPLRSDSAAARLLPTLLANPILSADDAIAHLGSAPSRAYAAIDRLHRDGVLRPLTTRTRNQIWGAAAVLDELDDLSVRVAREAR